MTALARIEEADERVRVRIAIGIATTGRPILLRRTLTELTAQTRAPDAVVICSPTPADVDGAIDTALSVRCVIGPRGLPHQRNTILRALHGFDVVIFLDDDFVPCPGYVAAMEAAFRSYPDIVMTTGTVIADGIGGPGLDLPDARLAIASDSEDPRDPIVDVYNGYGCNMAVRLETVRAHALHFDEQLPLYAWLEDVDFSRQIARFGRIVRVGAARGVHLGIKSGRQSGIRLGYSQIANPIYLVRKGTYSSRKAALLITRNILANVAKALKPEPYVDRIGRAIGNARALFDLFVGRMSPTRILSL